MKITQAKTFCSQEGSYFIHINVSHKPFSLHLRSFSGLFKFIFGNSVNTFFHMVNDIRSSIPDPDPQSLTLNPRSWFTRKPAVCKEIQSKFKKGFPPTFWSVRAMFAILSFGSISVCFGSNWAWKCLFPIRSKYTERTSTSSNNFPCKYFYFLNSIKGNFSLLKLLRQSKFSYFTSLLA